jgi:hypothetical protein
LQNIRVERLTVSGGCQNSNWAKNGCDQMPSDVSIRNGGCAAKETTVVKQIFDRFVTQKYDGKSVAS